MSIIFLFLVIS